MLDHSSLRSIEAKEICKSKSIVGAIGANDLAFVKESGGRLNLCLQNINQWTRFIPSRKEKSTGVGASLLLHDLPFHLPFHLFCA
jgi:hypothetical protein